MTNLHSNRGSFRMFTSLTVLVVAMVTCATSGAQDTAIAAKAQELGLKVTYIGNCGFLFTSGGQKILADALTEPSKQYPFAAPSPELLQKMERGEPPFDNINVVLISHNHSDHHSPASSVRFLLNNPKSILVTTTEVRAQMEKDSPEFKKIQSQVVVPQLEWKQNIVLEVNGIKLDFARLKHEDDGKWASIVYAPIFEMGGKKVLYAPATGGYFPDEYKTLDYAKRGIDVAFLNFDIAIKRRKAGVEPVLNPAGMQMVRDLIAPKVTVLMHVEPANIAAVGGLLPEVQKQLPGTVWLQHELDSQTF